LSDRGGKHTGQGIEPILHLLVERHKPGGLISGEASIGPNQQQVVPMESQILVLEIQQAVSEHPRPDQQNYRRRDLKDDQSVRRIEL
jgi:hypothetical protein